MERVERSFVLILVLHFDHALRYFLIAWLLQDSGGGLCEDKCLRNKKALFCQSWKIVLASPCPRLSFFFFLPSSKKSKRTADTDRRRKFYLWWHNVLLKQICFEEDCFLWCVEIKKQWIILEGVLVQILLPSITTTPPLLFLFYFVCLWAP